jgi:uncharacterized protein (TIGR03435 family)
MDVRTDPSNPLDCEHVKERMRTACIAAVILTTSALYAQTGGPTFEVASVKANKSGSPNSNAGRVSGDRYEASNVTLVQLLRPAYGIQEFQIERQPGWAGIERFDIVAKMPSDSKPGDWPVMLQNLLAERFHLKFHRGQRETDALALVIARGGPKLTPADPAACAPPAGSCGFRASPTQIEARGQSMEQLATRLSRSIGQTVVNRTDLTGIFDFKVEWTIDDQFRTAGATASPTIFTALTEQLGLRLQSQRTNVDVLVIDAVERPSPD